LVKEKFHKFAIKVTEFTGSAYCFMGAALVVLIWAILGPVLGFSEQWQLVINTGTTIVTFLMVFLIQHSQNTDTKMLHAKMDELLRAIPEAKEDIGDCVE
jgi:low affinity Fe/Cu permease